jgi:oligosaccharide repeat unit polymerase
MMIVLLIQYLMLFLDKNRISARILLRYAAGALIMVLIFGVIGDLRSGAEAFLALAQPSENFPKWMPSGFLWVYMYLTTPLNNLQFDVNKEMISYDLSFPNTLSLLFPSVIRNVLFDNSSAEDTLVTQAFNVGTAFQGPYLDCGRFGIFVFGFVVGFVSGCYYRNRSSLYFKISYSVIAQCCLLSIFYNHFCYLPILFQFFILYLIFRRRKALWRCAFPHARTGTVVEQG